MRAFMMNNEQTNGHGHTDRSRANGMRACDDQTSVQKQTQTAGEAPLVMYNKRIPQRRASPPCILMHAWDYRRLLFLLGHARCSKTESWASNCPFKHNNNRVMYERREYLHNVYTR